MKSWAFGAMVVSMFAVAACGKSPATASTTGDTGGTGGTGSNTTGSNTTGSNTTGSNTTGSNTTGSNTTGTGGAASCGGLEWSKDATCQDCVAMACCAELAACDTGTDCGALLDCLTPCTDMACQMKCQTDNSAGVPDAQALVSCAKSCDGASCSTGICATGLTSSKPACDSCLTTNCCTEFDSCVADAACKACLLSPMGAGCDMNAMAKAANMCKSTSCMAACM